MGRFKAKAIVMRDMESLTILFKDKETIWVFPKHASTNIIFHRWWMPKGSYGAGWQDFRRAMFRNAQLDVATCYRLCAKYRVQSMGTARAPDITGKTVKLSIKRR